MVRGPGLGVGKHREMSGVVGASGRDALTGRTTARVAGVARLLGAVAAALCSRATCGRELRIEGAAPWEPALAKIPSVRSNKGQNTDTGTATSTGATRIASARKQGGKPEPSKECRTS